MQQLSREGYSQELFGLGRCSENLLNAEACTAGALTISERDSNIT